MPLSKRVDAAGTVDAVVAAPAAGAAVAAVVAVSAVAAGAVVAAVVAAVADAVDALAAFDFFLRPLVVSDVELLVVTTPPSAPLPLLLRPASSVAFGATLELFFDRRDFNFGVVDIDGEGVASVVVVDVGVAAVAVAVADVAVVVATVVDPALSAIGERLSLSPLPLPPRARRRTTEPVSFSRRVLSTVFLAVVSTDIDDSSLKSFSVVPIELYDCRFVPGCDFDTSSGEVLAREAPFPLLPTLFLRLPLAPNPLLPIASFVELVTDFDCVALSAAHSPEVDKRCDGLRSRTDVAEPDVSPAAAWDIFALRRRCRVRLPLPASKPPPL